MSNVATTRVALQAFQFAAAILISAVLVRIGVSLPPPNPTLEWTRQFGTDGADFSYDVSTDSSGSVYLSGYTTGNLGGSNAGSRDAFIRKYDSLGNAVWTNQLGSNRLDISFGVSADDLGNVYIAGLTEGNLASNNAGDNDAFVSKYDSASGTLVWSRQIGTFRSDISFEVSADGLGHVYITGHTNESLGGPFAGGSDSFLSKFDSTGNLLWSRQQGTANGDGGEALAEDGLAGVFVGGFTMGSLGMANAGSADAFLSRYDTMGNLLWVRQLGTSSYDMAHGASADGHGNVFVAGYTEGSLGGPSAGNRDAFVAKYDSAGNLLWTRQIGTSAFEEAFGVSADRLGNVYISGYTSGSLGGPLAGVDDIFLSKFDETGNLQWTRQLGTAAEERSQSISVDQLGNVYASGYTLGDFGGANLGFEDALVMKFLNVPEPSANFMVFCASLTATIVLRRNFLSL